MPETPPAPEVTAPATEEAVQQEVLEEDLEKAGEAMRITR